jgi:two-component system, chemotaxis family, CheB/CheR fusion protein
MGKSKKAPIGRRRSARAGRQNSPRYIVGIGASAGGLEALRALFGSMKTAPRGMAFVVVQHLAPLHRSRLVELIASATKLPVVEVKDEVQPQAGCIYVTPPNANLLSEDGRLRLTGTELGPKPSVDVFLRSLASDAGPNAIGIVLSGTGSDGAHGMRAIKSAGGITMAQSAESAKYDSMPKAAMQAGTVERGQAPEEIAAELHHIARHGPGRRRRDVRKKVKGDPYESIMRSLESQVGVDFLKYKQTTIRRRLERRLTATGCATLEQYAAYLEATPGEAQSLLQNVLISVTAFFRDAEAFKALAQRAAERLKQKRDGHTFRVWVVGCATGEEAFSLSIVLSEAIEKSRKQVRLQVFATDLDEHALASARRATYPAAALVGVPKKLIDKYFEPQDDGAYRVRTSLRDTIVFARHNASEDAPFLNLDLLSCRNVLIYFNSRLQQQLFKTFEYALLRGGLLFLGKSEAVPQEGRGFRVLAAKHKIFERLGTRVGNRGELPHPTRREASRESAFVSRAREVGQALDLFNAVVNGLAPDSIVIDNEVYIKHVFGNAGEFLVHPAGQATQNLSKLLPGDMGIELMALLHRAERTGHAAAGLRHELKMKQGLRLVQLTVAPLATGGSKDYLVCFHASPVEHKAARRRGKDADGLPVSERAERLQKELDELREHLQTVREEQETTSEELQSLNEELQSSNEELQSSNEELETTNEELQSSNEELTTVNEELNVKSAELQSMNQRLNAIQSSIVHPLLVIDRDRNIISFNPAARLLFRLSEADLGSEYRAAGTLCEVEALKPLIDQAFRRKADARVQLEHAERKFEVQVQVFKGARGGVDGAVASFIDNTQILDALEDSRTSRQQLSSILESTPAIVTMKDLNGVYQYVNKRFAQMIGKPAEAIVGRTDDELFGRDTSAKLQEHDYEVIKKKKPLEVSEAFQVGAETRMWNSSKVPLVDARKRVQSVCTVSLDLTERIAHEQQLELFRRAFSASNNGLLIADPASPGCPITFASEALADLAGVPADSLLGMKLADLLRRLQLQASGATVEALADEISRNGSRTLTAAASPPSASVSWLELASRTVELQEGKRNVIVTFFDASQRVRDQRLIAQQQEELERVSRFSALTEIAAGIAHEVNTPLGVIVSKAGILKELNRQRGLNLPEAISIADDITRMAKNVSEIVHGLGSIASRRVDRLETTCMRQIVRDAAKMCEPRLHRISADLRLDLPETEVPVECYPVQIMQVIINLLNNAADASADRRERWVAVRVRANEQRAAVTVMDSGPGISSTLAEKIFTPFFTTKGDQKGTGIGLSLARSIARRHNGELVLETEAENTCFTLSLPRRQEVRVH